MVKKKKRCRRDIASNSFIRFLLDKIFSSEFYSEIQVWNQTVNVCQLITYIFRILVQWKETFQQLLYLLAPDVPKSLTGLFYSMVPHWHSLDYRQRPERW